MDFHTLGFYKCTVTKWILAASFILYVSLHTVFRDPRRYRTFTYDIEKVVNDLEVWRLITGKFIFFYPHEFLCGSLLLYHFREFERRFGSYKYVSFMFCAWLLTSVFEVAFVTVSGLKTVTPGTYWLLFSLLVFYWNDIPAVSLGRVGPLDITQKSFQYLLLLQLAFAEPNSYIFAGIGVLAGLLYYHNILGIKSWIAVPLALQQPVGNYGDKMFASSPPKVELMGATIPIQRQMQQEEFERRIQQRMRRDQVRGNLLQRLIGQQNVQQRDNSGPSQERIAYSEEAVTTLIDMGFQRDEAVNALRLTNNNVGNAATMLLQ